MLSLRWHLVGQNRKEEGKDRRGVSGEHAWDSHQRTVASAARQWTALALLGAGAPPGSSRVAFTGPPEGPGWFPALDPWPELLS